MAKGRQICFSRSQQSNTPGAAVLDVLSSSLETIFFKKEIIDCAALSKKSGKELWELSKKYHEAIVTLSFDGLDSVGPQAFVLLNSDYKDSAYEGTGSLAGHLAHLLAQYLANSYSITLPYYDESWLQPISQRSHDKTPDDVSFQLSRALLQYFLMKGFQLDDEGVLEKHKNGFNRLASLPSSSSSYPVGTSPSYFLNTTEAIVCLNTFHNVHRTPISLLYIDFSPSAFSTKNDLKTMLPRLLSECVVIEKECVIVLRNKQYEDGLARVLIYQFILETYKKLDKFKFLLHVFLLTKEVDDPLSNAYPDYSQSPDFFGGIPLLNNAGYYFSNPSLFQIMLEKNRLQYIPRVFFDFSWHLAEIQKSKQSAEIKTSFFADNKKQQRALAPSLTYVMQSQEETKQELQVEETVQVTEAVNQQQQLTVLQKQKQHSMQKQSMSDLFRIGIVHIDFNQFVVELTERLITREKKCIAEQKRFKLYLANAEKIDNLWGLGTPAVAAKEIASKLFGVGYQECDGKTVLIRTSASIDYIDTHYRTARDIFSHIEQYRDGVSFLLTFPDINNDQKGCFQRPMILFDTFNGKKELRVTENGPRYFYTDPVFEDTLLVSTLPLEAKSEQAKKAYYQLFNGQVLSKKRSDYSDRLMAVFWGELPCSSPQEQENFLNDYCALYREYDNSGDGEATIRAFLRESKNIKADVKRLLYVHIKGGEPFVKAMKDLFEKLENHELSALFYKIYFEKSDYISSLFVFLKFKIFLECYDSLLYPNEKLFATLPAKKDWLPYHRFIASFLLSFPLRSISKKPNKFWAQIELLVQTYVKDSKEEQQKILSLFADTIAGEDGLRIQGGCHPHIVFAALTKILSSAGNHWTFHEQIEMLADLPMAWCDALGAIEQGFRVVCREMKLETAYLNPVKEGETLSNGYKVSRADFEKALTCSSSSSAFLPLKVVLFRYLGCEIRRDSLSYYRLLFERTEQFPDPVLREKVIGWFVFYTTGISYTQKREEKNADIKKHFSAEEQDNVDQLLGQLHAIHFSAEYNVIHERYQLKSLLQKVPYSNDEWKALSAGVKQCFCTVIEKRYLYAFLQSHQEILQTGGMSFELMGNAFVEEALEEELFFKNSFYADKQRHLLQAFLKNLDQKNWAEARESIHVLLKDMTEFLQFFTKHASYRPGQEEILYAGLMYLADDPAVLQTIIAVFLKSSQYEEAQIDFSQLKLFFDALSDSNLELRKNKIILARMTRLILRANPPLLSQAKLYMQLAQHLMHFSRNMPLFDEIVALSENTQAEDWLRLCCQLDPDSLSSAIKLFHVVNNHPDTLSFLQKIIVTQKINSLEEWIRKLKLAQPNQRIFIFEIIHALMHKEGELDWIQWTISLRDLSLAELSALAKLSKEAQFSVANIAALIKDKKIIKTKNDLERRKLKPLDAILFASPEHTLEKINEIRYKPSDGHTAVALEYGERLALWRDYQTLQSLILDSKQVVFVEQFSTGAREVHSVTELTEAEMQILVKRIHLELTAASTPNFRRHDLEIMLIAVASVAMYRVTGRFPRDVQLLAVLKVLNNMNRAEDIVHEIDTGEGKGITAALHAILVWGRGRTADIVTMNDALAERDRKQFNPVYQYLGIYCGTEIISTETAPETCQKHGIYYGRWSSFFLLKIRMGIQWLAWFANRSLICDEMDAIINTAVESRLAASINPLFQDKKKWECLYHYLLDFVEGKNKPFNLSECKRYLEQRVVKEKLQNTTPIVLPKIDDALLSELLNAAVLAHTYQEKVHYSVVEKSVKREGRIEKYSYAAPKLDSTKSPDAEISWHWVQQFLHAKLNRNSNLPFPFEIETHTETVMTGSVKNFFDSYKQAGGTVYGLTGTAGSPADVKRFFEQNKCIAFKHPRYAANLRVDHGIKGAYGQSNHFALLLEELKKSSGELEIKKEGYLPFLVIFSSAKEVDDFYNYVQIHDNTLVLRLQRYDGVNRGGALSTENITEKAGKANTITLTTESLARGADVDPRHSEGLFGVNCCTALTDSDLVQIAGRPARAGKKGHFISIIDLDRLIPQRENETLEIWFARHRENFANQQAELRERCRPLQEIRYAVTHRLLNLNVELMTVLIQQEGMLSRMGEDDKTFLKTLSQLDQSIESKYCELLESKEESKEDQASINEKLIQFAIAEYEKSLAAVLRNYHLDDYDILELSIPLAEIPRFSELLGDFSLRDLAILSEAFSDFWKLAGNRAVHQGFKIADVAVSQLDRYLKGDATLQFLMIGQLFNMNFLAKEKVIDQLSAVQGKIREVLDSISDFKILNHSVLFEREAERNEIELWLRDYREHIKQCIANEKWDEIKPPSLDEGIAKKYLERFKKIISAVEAVNKVNKVVQPVMQLVQLLIFPQATIISGSISFLASKALPEGSTGSVMLFLLRTLITYLIKKQNINSAEKEKQLALLAAAEAIFLSIKAAVGASYSLDTPVAVCLKNIEGLFKISINDLLDKNEASENKHNESKSSESKSNTDQLNIVNGLLTFLKEQSILQNTFLEYFIQILPIVFALLAMPYVPSSGPQQVPKTYGQLSVREFFTAEVLFSFLTQLIKLPAFLNLLEDHPRVLAIINRLSELSLSSFEQLKKIAFPNALLVNFIRIVAHPHFSSFLSTLPKDANWRAMSAWLNYKEEKQIQLPPEDIQKAVDTLREYEATREHSQAAVKEKLRTLRRRFTLSAAQLTKELQTLHSVPACPETLETKPSAPLSAVAEIIAPVVYTNTEKIPEAKVVREEAPAVPPVTDWTTHASPPAAFLSAAMAYISRTGEARLLMSEAMRQMAAVISDNKMTVADQFNYIENSVSAVKQWQIIDAKGFSKIDYIHILKPALLTCMNNYRNCSGKSKSIDRYLLIRQLIKKTHALDTSEAILDLLASTKEQLLEKDREMDASFLYSFLGWRRNSKGSSRLLDQLDNMMAAVTAVMIAEGKGARAEACIEKANQAMLRSLVQREECSKELRAKLNPLLKKSAASYHPPLVTAQYHLPKDSYAKHMCAFYNSFNRSESVRQMMHCKESEPPRLRL